MFNQITLVGNATAKPELKYTPSGTAIAKFNIACNEHYVDKQTGERKEDTLFIEVTCFGTTADNAYKYVERGMRVLVSGKLGFDQWVDNNGHKRSRHYVKANKVVYLQCKSGNGNQTQQTQPQAQQQNTYQQASQQPYNNRPKDHYQERPPQQPPTDPNLDDYDEDVPF